MTSNAEHVFNNQANVRLTEDITSSAVTIDVIDGFVRQLLSGWSTGKVLYLTLVDGASNREVVKVTGISGNTLTVSRGQDGTAARSWYAGTLISQRLVAANLDAFLQEGAERIVASDPRGVLAANYPGEKIIQTGLVACQNRAFKNISGTNWVIMAGEECPPSETEIVSLATDGWIRNQGAPGTWAGYRDATDGTLADTNDQRHTTGIQASYHDGWYWIYRTFLYFDLSSIDPGATVSAVELDLTSYANALSDVSVQQGTQQDALDTSDFDAFTGSPFDTITWLTGGGGADLTNTFTFNAAGIAYIQSIVTAGGVAKLCVREDTYDVQDVDPAPGPIWTDCGVYYADTGTASKRPTLKVTAL